MNLRRAAIATTATVARVGYSLGTLCTLAALLLFAGVASPQEQPRTFRIPFHEVHGATVFRVKAGSHVGFHVEYMIGGRCQIRPRYKVFPLLEQMR